MNTKPPRGFTLEEHWTVGTLLYNSQSALQGLFITVSRAYPLQSRQVRQFERSLKGLEAARSELDNAMFREHGEAASTHAYYPGSGAIEVMKDGT